MPAVEIEQRENQEPEADEGDRGEDYSSAIAHCARRSATSKFSPS